MQWHAEELAQDDAQMLVIPEGFAHGFQALEPDSELLYLHTAFYNPPSEGGLRHDDPRLAIAWPCRHRNCHRVTWPIRYWVPISPESRYEMPTLRHALGAQFCGPGLRAPSNAYLQAEDLRNPEVHYPLRVKVCDRCWLVQTEDYAALTNCSAPTTPTSPAPRAVGSITRPAMRA